MADLFTPSASDSGERYGGSREERAFSVKQTSDGGYTIIKTDPNGNLQWARVYSNPSLDDEFGGAQSRSSSSQNEILVMKINSSGDLQWVKWFGDTIYSDQAYSVKRTSDGGYIVAGRTGSYGYDVQITSDGGFVVDY
jgi:hypothetical protein